MDVEELICKYRSLGEQQAKWYRQVVAAIVLLGIMLVVKMFA